MQGQTKSVPSAATSADWLWLGAILSIALVLRVINLNAGLWYDEIDTLVHYTRLPATELLTTYPSLNHHVLFTLEARGAIVLLGESPEALRLPALIFGVASIWALWLLARQVVSPWEARLSALLLAVSYHHVWFSQNARGYTGLLFWGLIATYFLLLGAKGGSWRLWTAYGVVSALAVYTHLSAAFLIAAHGLLYIGVLLRSSFLTKRGTGELSEAYSGFSGLMPLYGLVLAGLLALLLHAPLIPQMISTFSEVASAQSPADAAATAEWKSPLWMFREVARSLGPVLGIALPIVIVVVSAGMIGLRKKGPLLPLLVLVHIPLTLAILVIASMRVWPRYFFIDIGFICIFLIHGAFVMARIAAARLKWNINAATLGLMFSALGIAASLVLLPRNYVYPKQDFLGARDFVEAHRSTDSVVVTVGLAAMPYADYYAPHWQKIESLDELTKLARSSRQVWLVYAFPSITERRNKDIIDHVSTKFEKMKRFPGTLSGGDVIVFRSMPE